MTVKGTNQRLPQSVIPFRCNQSQAEPREAEGADVCVRRGAVNPKLTGTELNHRRDKKNTVSRLLMHDAGDACGCCTHINLPTFYEIQILELFTSQHSTDRNDASFIAAKISFSLEKRTENDKIAQPLLDDGLVVQSNQPFYCIFPRARGCGGALPHACSCR